MNLRNDQKETRNKVGIAIETPSVPVAARNSGSGSVVEGIRARAVHGWDDGNTRAKTLGATPRRGGM